MSRKFLPLVPIFVLLLHLFAFASSSYAQDVGGDALQIGDQRTNEFSYAPLVGGAGTVETIATFSKSISRTTMDYRVGVFNDLAIDPGNSNSISGKYLTFGTFSRVSIPVGATVNTTGPSEIYGSYSAARNSGVGEFSGRTIGGRMEAVDDHSAGSTWGVIGAEISAYIEDVLPKYGSMGAAINVVNNATANSPESSPYLFGISTSVTNNGDADVTEQAVISIKNLGGSGTGIIPNMYGIKINQPSTAYGSKVYNNYGIFIADHSTIGDYQRYNIYSKGPSSKNYFEGEVQVAGELRLNDQCRGVATLDKGEVIVSSTCVHDTSVVVLTRRSSSRDNVTYSYDDIVDGTSFSITSSYADDECQVSWLVIN